MSLTGCTPCWEEYVDVIVVGSGFAGLSAAVEAARAGASVLILEKMPYEGGNSRISGGGYCCWDSGLHLREKLGRGEDSWQLHMEDTLKAGGGYSDPALVEVLAKEAPAGLDFLTELGVEFSDVLPRLGGHSVGRNYHTVGNTGIQMEKCLLDAALKEGAQLRLNTAVESLWRTDGRVDGVRVRTEQGDTRDIRAERAVVLASGGYAQDVRLRLRHNPMLVESCGCTNHRGATGEVLTAARAVGADALHMNFVQLFPCANPTTGGIDPFALACCAGPDFGVIYVDKTGSRFVNELSGRDEVSNAQLKLGEGPTWALFSGTMLDKVGMSAENRARGLANGRIVRSESAAQLAQEIGLPAQQLEQTLARHNGMLCAGRDEQLNKPITATMEELGEGELFAIAQWPSIHFCMGGLRIRPDTAVLDIHGEVIAGLYAAGEVCGGLHGANRLGGNALSECIVFGRRAGRAAAGTAAEGA